MKITAVVLAYWPQRVDNVQRLIQDLQQSSRPPDTILVLNNNPNEIQKIDIEFPRNTLYIESSRNLGCRIRHIVALSEPSDLYLYVDDDLTVKKDTVKNFETHYTGIDPENKGVVLGYWGKTTHGGDRPYKNTTDTWANKIEKPEQVDFLLGRIHAANHVALVKALATRIEYGMFNSEAGGEDDIILGMSNESWVIPATKSEFFEDLDDKKVGLARRGDHFTRRDKAVANFLKYKKNES